METITIQVDAEVAKAYREAETQQQQNATMVCNLILKEFFKPTSFQEIVEQIREEAKANGLTEEILAKLLEEE